MNIAGIVGEIARHLDKISNGNAMIAGALSLWVLGVGTYLLRNIPVSVYKFLRKHTTTELAITSQNEVFHSLLVWLQDNGYSAKFRKIKLTNGRFGWGGGKGTTKSVGYGTHLVWYCGHPILIVLNKEETKSEYDKEMVSLHKFGRSHKIFDRLIDEISNKDEDKGKTRVHKYNKGWIFIGLQPKRPIDSVVLEQARMDLLIDTLDEFVSSEAWYVKHGIPYQLGILFYGPPGTGKTSLIRAVASYMNRSLCIARLSSIDSLEDMLQSSPDNALVMLEDIDTSSSTKKRARPKATPASGRPTGSGGDGVAPLEPVVSAAMQIQEVQEAMLDYASASLSEVLNAIDGVVVRHGRILVMTTNNPEKLDEAILRPGRVDLKLEVGYMTAVTLEVMLRRFFEGIPKDYFKGRTLKSEKLTGSVVQGAVRKKQGYEEIVATMMDAPGEQGV